MKGHFARGASSSGLDTSLDLDAASSWAALFCHEIGDDAKAVECLEFAYETFFLANQQIVASATANSYNQAWQQLTPFDGFKPYADSTGGYSGSPASVSMEGTLAMLAGLLRLSDNADLGTYFSTNYAGGLPSLIGRLVDSMKIVAGTTGSGGLLSYSLASRALPWEIAVRKTVSCHRLVLADGPEKRHPIGHVFDRSRQASLPEGSAGRPSKHPTVAGAELDWRP